MNASFRSLLLPLLLTLAAAGCAQAQRNPPPAPPQAQRNVPPAPPQAQQQPAAAPAVAPQYRLSQGDIVRITVFQNPDLSIETRINEHNPALRVVGVLVCQVDRRWRIGQEAREALADAGVSKLAHEIPAAVRVGAAPRYAMPTISLEPDSRVAAAFRQAADELVDDYPGLEVHGVVGDFERHLGEVPPPDGGGRLVAQPWWRRAHLLSSRVPGSMALTQ